MAGSTITDTTLKMTLICCLCISRKWLLANQRFKTIVERTKNSKRAKTILRRVTISRRTLLIQRNDVPQFEVSLDDERRNSILNEKANIE